MFRNRHYEIDARGGIQPWRVLGDTRWRVRSLFFKKMVLLCINILKVASFS